ncbi:AraC family transcriptional regulator [Nocardia sp. NBC_00565]|uniref:AraC family transcriptional regulator n=1 Tax=Nocardia sp. NBC_00565 TaxID=2975993 RepID=UPI002E82317C|nr:AraC family transcriptional regulator [Nocardia sp. NBC_00565]WUC04320.1 AraC family transcriptional regulator [Nocardia sp. NBC_00565]
MDVLTDVLAATKLGGSVTAKLTAVAPWGIRMDDVPKATFHAVIQGSCWLRRPGVGPVQLAAGDFTLMPTGIGHALSSAPDSALVPNELVETDDVPRRSIRIEGTGAETKLICGAYRYDAFPSHPLLRLLPPLVHLPAGQSPEHRELADTLRLLATEVERERPGVQTIADRLVDIVFVQVLRLWSANRAGAGASWLAALRDPEVSRAMEFMHEDPGWAWTVEELAGKVGVSRATLARRFTALVGEPPLTYLARWRLELAARRLRDSPDSVAAVGKSVGYASEFAFSRAFKRAHGASPANFRLSVRARTDS